MAKDEEQNLNEMQDTLDNEQNLEPSDNASQEPSTQDVMDQSSEEGLEEISDTPQKKAKKLNKYLIIAASVLVFTLLVLMVLFFIGVFDKEEPQPSQQAEGELPIREEIVLPLYQFSIDDINVTRLNKKLSSLVDYTPPHTEPSQTVATQQQKQDYQFYDEDIESLFVKKSDELDIKDVQDTTTQEVLPSDETPLLITQESTTDITTPDLSAEEKSATSEDITETIIADISQENQTLSQEKEEVTLAQDDKVATDTKPIVTEQLTIATNDKNGSQFLKFIQVATLKYKLYTQFLKEIKAVDARISICQEDRGRIQIFIGPFLDDNKRKFVIEQINKNIVSDAFAIEFTQEEFNKRCGIHEPN